MYAYGVFEHDFLKVGQVGTYLTTKMCWHITGAGSNSVHSTQGTCPPTQIQNSSLYETREMLEWISRIKAWT